MSALSKHRAEVEFFREHPGVAFDEGARHDQEIEYQVEHWNDIVEELKPLFSQHWKELKEEHDIELNIDWERYSQLDRLGKLHLVTARCDGWLIGYDTGLILNDHLHYKGTLICNADVTWLLPKYRKGMIGYRMMKLFRDTAMAKGVKKMFAGCTTMRSLDILYRRLGYKPRYILYSKVLP